jgi:ParB/RepB/Spo0J family partition protein
VDKVSSSLHKGEAAAIWVDVSNLHPWDENPRENEHAVPHVMESIERFGFASPIIARKNGEIIAGHTRWKAAQKLGLEKVPVRYMDLDPADAKMLAIADNKLNEIAEWDQELLVDVLKDLHELDEDLTKLGFSEEELSGLIDGFSSTMDEFSSDVVATPLAEQFIIPPLTTLDARRGYWQERKTAWLSIGIRSEVGRKGDMVGGFNDAARKMDIMKGSKSGTRNPGFLHGTSIFDPVLCEIAYRWFSFVGADVLDPFAGGSVRGVVAAKLGNKYTGIELREEQVESNREQGLDLLTPNEPTPEWICGDSLLMDEFLGSKKFDFIFSCPPYYDLELYSDDDKDISNAGTYEDFIDSYKVIIEKSVNRLRENRFAVFVVGDVRCKKTGAYRNFVSDTIKCFLDAGMKLYNEAILLTIYASAIMRVGKQMRGGRKLGKTHQNVLVFYKGDTRKIKNHFDELDVSQFGDVLEVESQSFDSEDLNDV